MLSEYASALYMLMRAQESGGEVYAARNSGKNAVETESAPGPTSDREKGRKRKVRGGEQVSRSL